MGDKKRRFFLRSAAFLLTASFCLPAASAAGIFSADSALSGRLFPAATVYGADRADVNRARERADKIQEEKDRTDQKIRELQGVRDNALEYVKQLDGQLGQLQDELDQIAENRKQTEQEIKDTGKKLGEAEETEKKQYAEMKLRIRYMYEKGDSTFLELLLTSGSAAELLNRAEYIAQITEYDRRKLDEYKATRQEIADSKAKLEEDHQNILDLQAETEAKQHSVRTLADAKNEEISRLAAQIDVNQGASDSYARELKDEQAAIAAMEEEIRAAEAEAERKAQEAARAEAEKKAQEAARAEAERKAQAEAAGAGGEAGAAPEADGGKNAAPETEAQANPGADSGEKAEKKAETKAGQGGKSGGGSTTVRVVKGSGSLEWPCPSSSTITSGYGARSAPTDGASTNHRGIDISASSGSGIVAADGGTVAIAGYSSTAGNYVMITHGNGLSTVYMHCSKLLVSAGETVAKGEAIAKVGSTGVSTGPHLHFAVRKDGNYVNPLNYVNP